MPTGVAQTNPKPSEALETMSLLLVDIDAAAIRTHT